GRTRDSPHSRHDALPIYASHPRLALVGKGVCFDTGGLDLKGADGMRNMKKDMGGAAHALALAELVMRQRLPVRLQLVLPLVENSDRKSTRLNSSHVKISY